VRPRSSLALAALLVLGLVASLAPGGVAGATADGRDFFRTHGYLPIHGADTLARAKAYAAAWAAQQHPQAAQPTGATAPIIGASWQGQSQSNVSPPDPNGAIGPSSYIEIINQRIGIYDRTGGLVNSATLTTLTGHSSVSDPMILWDPDTQRFYYNVWNTSNAKMDWGFSRDGDPTNIPGDFCNYETGFGYLSTNAPDYPKLGQTKQFLMIGVNFYPTFSDLHATRSDLLWIGKPQGDDPITTCPAADTFKSGSFKDLRNEDGTQAFTPVPAIQTDPSNHGFVMTMSDIECPDICGNGALITVHALRPKPSRPTVPQLFTTGQSLPVATYTSPPDAPQKGSTDLLDTLDGRLTHAVSGVDPRFGNTAVWLAHTVMGGAGAEIRWYEVQPTPVKSPSLLQSGAATNASLYVYNAGISTDRTVNLGGTAHGSAMVLGFNTSSGTQFAAVQMVSKIGAGAQSAFVLVKQSTVADNDFTCNPVCRWGDYGGATPDPAADLLAATGKVWLSQQWTDGTAETWNWEATP
jgi:hypothetical protein